MLLRGGSKEWGAKPQVRTQPGAPNGGHTTTEKARWKGEKGQDSLDQPTCGKFDVPHACFSLFSLELNPFPPFPPPPQFGSLPTLFPVKSHRSPGIKNEISQPSHSMMSPKVYTLSSTNFP